MRKSRTLIKGRTMKFKKLLSVGATAATLLGVLAGTGVANAAPAKVTLNWWTWTTNPGKVIANFEKAYPNITIPTPPNYGSGGTFYTKLTTELAGGTGRVSARWSSTTCPLSLPPTTSSISPSTFRLTPRTSRPGPGIRSRRVRPCTPSPRTSGPWASCTSPASSRSTTCRCRALGPVRLRCSGVAQGRPGHVPHLLCPQ